MSEMTTVFENRDANMIRQLQQLVATPSRKITQLGDSRTAMGWNAGSASYEFVKTQNGYQMWAEAFSALRIRFPPELNFGVSGDTTAMVLARTPAAIAAAETAGSGIVIIHAGVNDRTDGGNIALSTSQANMLEIIELILDAGLIAVLTNETPRMNFPSTQQAVWHVAFHEWLTRIGLSTKGVIHLDTWTSFVDPSVAVANTTSDLRRSGLYRDTVHYLPAGARLFGSLIAALFTTFSVPAALVSTAADLYSADFPAGNLVPKGLMQGTTGTNGGGGLSGGWSALTSNGTGLTVTYSKTTNGVYDVQRVVISGTPTAANPSVSIYSDSFLANVVEGDRLEAMVMMKLATGATGVRSLDYEVQATGGKASTVGRYLEEDFSAARIVPDGFDWLPFVAPPLTVPAVAGLTSIQNRLVARLVQNEAVSLTLDLARASSRKL